MTERTLRRTESGVMLILGLLAALIALRLIGMDLLPLMDTTEARYGEIGRKMAALGNWVTPWHDDGVPFWGKPPLSFWLTALSFKVFGVSEFAARLPHLICAIGIAWATWQMAWQRSKSEGLFALVLLSSAVLFYVSAGAVMTDGALVLGSTLAMLSFWLGVSQPARGKRWLLFLGIAIGLLAKGPLALVLIGTPILAWTFLRRKLSLVWHAFPWLIGMLWVAILVIPWYVMAEIRTPGFLQYFLVGEHWHRFVTPGWKGDLYGNAHRFPIGTIWLFTIGAAMPWSLFLPIAELYRRYRALPLKKNGDAEWMLYLLAWALTPLMFFTAARNIIWTYALPALPALALLAAGWLGRWPEATAQRLIAGGLVVLLALTSVFGLCAIGSSSIESKSARSLVNRYNQSCADQGPLVYVDKRPFSASFYSGGHAMRVAQVSDLPSLLKTGGACVALRDDEAAALAMLPDWTATKVVAVDQYTLWAIAPQVRSGAAATASSMTKSPNR